MPAELSWTAHPARTRPRDLALVVSVLLLTTGAVLSTFQSMFFAVLAVTILVATIAPFLFPTRYHIDDWGIREVRLGRTRARPWTELRRVQIGRQGALVSPFAKASWMDRYRGMTILFDGADRSLLIDRLRCQLSPEINA